MASLYTMDEIVRLSKLGKKDEEQYMQLIIKYIKTNGKALSNLRKNNNNNNDINVKEKQDVILNNIKKAKSLLPGGDMPGKLKRKRKRESKDNNINKAKTCTFYVERKHRCCHFIAIPGTDFCPNHTQDGVDRVKCPLNNNHSVLRKNLKAHLLRCNDRNKGGVNEIYYKKNINLLSSTAAAIIEDNDDKKKKNEKKKKKKLEYNECLLVLKLLKNMVKNNKAIQKFFPIKEIILKPKECDELFEKKSNLKHVKQNSSIAGHVKLCCNSINTKNVNESHRTKLVIVEVGAGKGFLSLAIQKAVNEAKHYILVDNQHFRNRADKALKDSNAKVERQYIDLKDLYLENTRSLNDDTGDNNVDNSLVFVGKHVCGVATCYTLNCVERILLLKKKNINVGGAIIASCCHHKCVWNHYVNQNFFLQNGFTPYDFTVMTRMSSWAVSGNHDVDDEKVDIVKKDTHDDGNKKKKMKYNTNGSSSNNNDNNSDIGTSATSNDNTNDGDDDNWWSTEEKREIGNMCKIMMDVGRIFLFRDQGFHVDIVKYTDEKTSMENRLLCINV